jgi:hypothetical protein
MGKARSRRRRHRSRKVEARPDDVCDWIVVDGRRYVVAGYTPGGVPYGCFEDEIDERPAVGVINAAGVRLRRADRPARRPQDRIPALP